MSNNTSGVLNITSGWTPRACWKHARAFNYLESACSLSSRVLKACFRQPLKYIPLNKPLLFGFSSVSSVQLACTTPPYVADGYFGGYLVVGPFVAGTVGRCELTASA